MHLGISRVMQNAMRAITHDTWRLEWFVGQLYRFQCTGVHTMWVRWLVCSGLRWYLLNVPAYVCVHVTDSRTRTKSKFSHSVTSFQSKLLHTSQRLSTSQIFLLSFSLKLRNIASAIIKRLYRRNSLLTWCDLNETYILEIFFHTCVFSCTKDFYRILVPW